MKVFVLIGLLWLVCSCAALPKREPLREATDDAQNCGTPVDYTQGMPWAVGPVTLQADGYTGAKGGEFWVDDGLLPAGPDLTVNTICKPGLHHVRLIVYVEDQMLCEVGTFSCQ